MMMMMMMMMTRMMMMKLKVEHNSSKQSEKIFSKILRERLLLLLTLTINPSFCNQSARKLNK